MHRNVFGKTVAEAYFHFSDNVILHRNVKLTGPQTSKSWKFWAASSIHFWLFLNNNDENWNISKVSPISVSGSMDDDRENKLDIVNKVERSIVSILGSAPSNATLQDE